MEAANSVVRRPPRSYILRGRSTAAQERAWSSLRGRYLVAAQETPPDWAALFGRRAPLVAELGSGFGEATMLAAADNRQNDYVAFEVHRPGVGALMNRLAQADAGNAKIVCDDAMRFLPLMFFDGALAGVNIFFPDPWPKTRHWKRRMIRPPFVSMLADKLACGGFAHFATDWADYAKWTAKVFADCPAFAPCAPPPRPPSGYERRAAAARRAPTDLCYRRLPVTGGAPRQAGALCG